MLVESRFGARRAVAQALRGAHLFADIVEATSLNNGIERLAAENYDACIVGSTVSRAKAAEFLTKAHGQTRSPDCAFIVLEQEGDEAILMANAEAPFWQTLSWPCPPRTLAKGVVVAVVKTNDKRSIATVVCEASPMTALAASPEAFQEAQAAQVAAPPNPPSAASPVAKQGPAPNREAPNVISERELLASIVAGGVSDLSQIADAVSQGVLGLDAERRPTEESLAALGRVIDILFAAHLESPRIRQFRDYFSDTLQLWFVDLCTYGSALATNTLRHSLFDYARIYRKPAASTEAEPEPGESDVDERAAITVGAREESPEL